MQDVKTASPAIALEILQIGQQIGSKDACAIPRKTDQMTHG